MRAAIRIALIVLTPVLVSAQGMGGGLTVSVNNGSTDNLLVTAYDLNVQPPQKILSSEVINGNASISVSITADASGRGHLAWTSTTVDRDMRSCGRGDSPQLNDGDSVSVNADTDC